MTGRWGCQSTATNLITGWEDKVDEILGSASSEPDKARQMLEMFPQLPADGQEEVARHLTNLLPDQDYGLMRSLPDECRVAGGRAGCPARRRSQSAQQPETAGAAGGGAQRRNTPRRREAKDFLELFLEEDYGNDWDKWQAGIEQWLKANPD